MIKTLNKLGIEGNYHNTYEKATANMLNCERLKVFPLQSGTREGCPHSPLLHSIEFLARVIKQEKKNKRHSNLRGKRKIISVH